MGRPWPHPVGPDSKALNLAVWGRGGVDISGIRLFLFQVSPVERRRRRVFRVSMPVSHESGGGGGHVQVRRAFGAAVRQAGVAVGRGEGEVEPADDPFGKDPVLSPGGSCRSGDREGRVLPAAAAGPRGHAGRHRPDGHVAVHLVGACQGGRTVHHPLRSLDSGADRGQGRS